MNNKIQYFVDESGDLNLFNKKGVPISKGPGFIMLGLLKIKEERFEQKFLQFKDKILADPIFNTFESINKTKESFHAKDDHIAIKREVFNFLKDLDVSVKVIIRRKPALIEHAKSQFESYGKKLTDKQIYSSLVTGLFKGSIHKADHYEIIFSQRGNSTDTHSLKEALNKAHEIFYYSWKKTSNSTVKIKCCIPSSNSGLQVIDYHLWALQRLYVKHEDVYFSLIKDKFSLIIDVDDKRNKPYGEYYTRSKPLILDNIKG